MTPEEKAKELIKKYEVEIATSDFHVPEFITGVPMADGSYAYSKILREETFSLAILSAIICVDEILPCTWKWETYKKLGYISVAEETTTEYWQKVKSVLVNICPECHGEGTVAGKTGGSEGIPEADVMFVCNECNGTGKINKQ